MSAQTIKLSEVADFIRGVTFDKSQQQNVATQTNIPVLRAGNIQNELNIQNDLIFVPREVVAEAQFIKSGDIAICLSSGSPQIVGKSAALRQDWCGTVGGFCGIIRPNKIDPEFLAMWLRGPEYISWRDEQARGANIQNLRFSELGELELRLPERVQQRQIAARLKAQLAEVETAQQAAQLQLREASALKKRSLESLFSSIPNWSPIGDAAKLQSGYAFKSDHFKTSGVRLLRNANILPSKVYWDDAVFLSESDSEKYPSYELNSGDVLISLDRPIISSGIKVAQVSAEDLPALLLQRVGRFLIDPQKLDADYLYAYLQTDLFISKITGHDQSLGVPHISPSQVEAIEIPLPEISVQKELSKKLNDVTSTWEMVVSAMQSQLNDLSKLPKAILAQAFKV
ncbi:MAG: restriction endonuclease subunit S [Methylotenera sp.]|nr:restriction endonuclease subunit S [Methylotenera sp.]